MRDLSRSQPTALDCEGLWNAALEDGLLAFPFVRLTVTGSCMAPALVEGDHSELVSTTRRHPLLGEIVLVRFKDGLRLHRLVWGPPFARARGPWRTRADRGIGLDPAIDPAQVLAVAVAVEGRGPLRPRPLLAVRALCRALWARTKRLGATRP
jgi:hypothetical protein